jgi:hypothetical protein
MEKEFVNYDIALEMKQLGFDEPCQLGWYLPHSEIAIKAGVEPNYWQLIPTHPLLNQIAAPTFSQAFRFFREVYGLKHDIDDDNVGTKFYYKIRSYTDKFDNYDDIIKPMREERDWSKIEFYSYEEAELATIVKLIEIVKEKKK